MIHSTQNLSNIKIASTIYGIKTIDQFENINFAEFLEKLKNPECGEKDGSHFIRTAMIEQNGKCLSRSDQNTESLAYFLVIDGDRRINSDGKEVDGAPDPRQVHNILRENNIGHFLYGSHSHYVGDVGPRYRIIIPTTVSYNKQQLAPAIESIIGLINSNLHGELLANAKENCTWAQPWYCPRMPADSTIPVLYYEYLEGNTFDVTNPLALEPITKTKNAINDSSKYEASPIMVFNNRHPITNLLTQYGYKLCLKGGNYDKWLRPHSTSKQPGILVKENKLFSYHNHALNDGYWHDSFDLMCYHEKLTPSEAAKKILREGHIKTVASNDSQNKNEREISFQEYKPFSDDLLPVESIPYDALPEKMTAYITEHSEIRGCPPDYILVSLLARLGCVLAGKIKIALTKNTTWCAIPNFYWMMIGNSSSGKSNAFGLTSKLIQVLDTKARTEYKEAVKTYKDKYDLLERKLNASYKKLDKACSRMKPDPTVVTECEQSIQCYKQQIDELEKTKPKLKRYVIQKLTIEKLILILEENPEGIILEIDELSSMFIRLSKDENCEERGLYLTGYNGNLPYSYDMVKRGTVLIPNAILSILGGAQPSKIKRFINEARNGSQDDGFLQRFQGVVYPDKKLMLPVDKESTQELENNLTQLFENIATLSSISDTLQFDDEAQNIFDTWRETMTKEAHEQSYPINAHIGKSYEFVAALSGYLYVYENNGSLTENKLISRDCVLSAIKLGSFF